MPAVWSLGFSQGNVYQRFVVQSLIANHTWSSRVDQGAALYHVGTMPDKRGDIFVSDLRLMVGSQPARQAGTPSIWS